jgi:Zn-dependent protease with chaperone function
MIPPLPAFATYLPLIPLRIPRVLLILLLVSLSLTVVDELVLWSDAPAFLRVMMIGLTSAAMVFVVIFRGGSAIRFAMRTEPSTLTGLAVFFRVLIRSVRRRRPQVFAHSYAAMRSVMKKRTLPERIQTAIFEAMTGAVTGLVHSPRAVLYRSRRPSAVTASDGLGHCCIFVSTALVNALSTQRLTAVLAHECGHAKNRHPLKQAMVLGLLAGFKMSIGIPSVAVVVVLLAYLMMLREWEYVADRHACSIVGATTMISTFEEYRSVSGDEDISGWRELLCGHPSLHRRIAACGNL